MKWHVLTGLSQFYHFHPLCGLACDHGSLILLCFVLWGNKENRKLCFFVLSDVKHTIQAWGCLALALDSTCFQPKRRTPFRPRKDFDDQNLKKCYIYKTNEDICPWHWSKSWGVLFSCHRCLRWSSLTAPQRNNTESHASEPFSEQTISWSCDTVKIYLKNKPATTT